VVEYNVVVALWYKNGENKVKIQGWEIRNLNLCKATKEAERFTQEKKGTKY
jgi:hypothetical protein